MGQYRNADANLKQSFNCTNILLQKLINHISLNPLDYTKAANTNVS